MIIGAIIVGLITIALIIYTNVKIERDNGNMSFGVFLGVLVTMFSILEFAILSDINEKPEPTAMDVYQGKTTLKYEVVDNVKVDSVVIFKNNEKED